MRFLHTSLAALLLCALACPGCEQASAQVSGATSGASRGATNSARSFGGCTTAPTVTNVSASSGREDGGTSVTVTGTCFSGATDVKFNGVSGSSLAVTNSTTLTVTTPAYTSALSSTGASNAIAVAVTTPLGTGTLNSGFTYTSKFKAILGSLYVNEYRANDPALTVATGVSNLPDYNGNGAATQGTGSLQPAFSSTSFNGGPGITGDGSNDVMTATFTTPIATGSRPYEWWAGQWVAATSGRRSGVLSDAGFTNDFLDEHVNGTNFALYRGGFGVNRVEISGADTNRHLFEGGYTASGTNAFCVDATCGNSTNTGVTEGDLTRIVMFAAPGPGSYANFRMAVRVIANGQPSAQQITDMRAAFKDSNWIGYTSTALGLP